MLHRALQCGLTAWLALSHASAACRRRSRAAAAAQWQQPHQHQERDLRGGAACCQAHVHGFQVLEAASFLLQSMHDRTTQYSWCRDHGKTLQKEAVCMAGACCVCRSKDDIMAEIRQLQNEMAQYDEKGTVQGQGTKEN